MLHPELNRFETIYRLADKLIVDDRKEVVAEAARILALDLAQYRAMYGELPADEYVSLVAVDSLTPELPKTPADGMWRTWWACWGAYPAMNRTTMRYISADQGRPPTVRPSILFYPAPV